MQKHLIRTIVFVIIFIIFTAAADTFLTFRYRSFTYDEYDTLNKIWEGNLAAEIAILGTSRAQNHFYPPAITAVTNKTAFNFGLEGTGLEEQLLLLDFYLSRNQNPQILIISLDPYSFDERWLSNRPFHEERYFPYIKDEIVLKHLKNKNGLRAYAWRYLPLFRYIDMRRFKPINVFNKKNRFEDGSLLIEKEWDETFEEFIKQYPKGITYTVNPVLVDALKQLIQKARDKDIEIVLVLTPTFAEEHQYENNRSEILGIYRTIANAFRIPFLDYSNHALSRDQYNFYNSQHLKKSAALEFSSILADDLLKLEP